MGVQAPTTASRHNHQPYACEATDSLKQDTALHNEWNSPLLSFYSILIMRPYLIRANLARRPDGHVVRDCQSVFLLQLFEDP